MGSGVSTTKKNTARSDAKPANDNGAKQGAERPGKVSPVQAEKSNISFGQNLFFASLFLYLFFFFFLFFFLFFLHGKKWRRDLSIKDGELLFT